MITPRIEEIDKSIPVVHLKSRWIVMSLRLHTTEENEVDITRIKTVSLLSLNKM